MLTCYAERRTELFDYVPVLEGALAPMPEAMQLQGLRPLVLSRPPMPRGHQGRMLASFSSLWYLRKLRW